MGLFYVIFNVNPVLMFYSQFAGKIKYICFVQFIVSSTASWMLFSKTSFSGKVHTTAN